MNLQSQETMGTDGSKEQDPDFQKLLAANWA